MSILALGNVAQKEEAPGKHQGCDRVAELEGQIANLVGFLANRNASPAVAERLGLLEAELVRERRLKESATAAQALFEMPSSREVTAHVRELRKLMVGDPLRVREALRNRFAGGCQRVRADVNGDYVARGELVPLEFFMRSNGLKTKTAPEGAVSSPKFPA